MKNLLLLSIAVILLSGCTGPDKLLEDNRPDKAFSSILRMKSQKKLTKYYPELVASYGQLQSEADDQVKKLLNEEGENRWPHIYFTLLNGMERQSQAQALLAKNSLTSENFAVPNSWNDRLEEARVKSADYYYGRVVNEKMRGDKGDKMAYRSAHRLALRVEDFVADYEDVRELQSELKILGTDYVLMYPEYGRNHSNGEWLWDDFVNNVNLPLKDEWVAIDAEASALERTDYWLQVGIDNLIVGANIEDNYYCQNSKEIKVGTKTEKQWSVQDSAYVSVEVDVLKTVSISVRNTFQEKRSEAFLDLHLIASDSEEVSAEKSRRLSYTWENSYGSSSGDSRAEDVNCREESGCPFSFPSEYSMVTNLEHCMRGYVKDFLKDNLDMNFRKRKNRRLAFR